MIRLKFKCQFSDKMKICLFLFGFVITVGDGQNIKQCAEYQIHFEKLLGYRPAMISSLSVNFGVPFERKILYKSFHHEIPSVINLQCMELCRNDHNCESYVLNFNLSECYGFTTNERSLQKLNLQRLEDLVEDISVVMFSKTCLNIPLTCNSIFWPLLRIPGSSLVGRGYLTINKLVTRRECIERCFFESTFKCRSVSFQISQRNNNVRMGFSNILNKEIMGQCILSRADKNTVPDSFRAAQINDEYIENQCQVVMNGADVQFIDDLCAYEHYPESAFVYAETQFVGLSDKECQEKCFKEKLFFCKGITYTKMDRVENSRCYIHSEDILSMGPRAVISMKSSYYAKRVMCLNLNVRCTHSEMIIRYNPRQLFRGRIYTENHDEECGVSASYFGPTFLTLPLGSSVKESRCGISRAFDFETPNRTLIFTYIIIQNNPLVMMQSDRYIKVGCISRFNRTNNSGIPDIVSLEASMEFGSKDYESSGSLLINDGGDVPKLNVQILDAADNTPVKEAKIGQILKFVIAMESHIDSFDLRAINLTATSELDRLELIGPTGCPKNSGIFPALQHEKKETSRQLFTRFRAFKFASSSLLKFNVDIQFCYNTCKPTNCGNGIISYGRKKRHTSELSSTLGRVIFPNDDETIKTSTIDSPSTIPGVRVDAFGNPQGIQQYLEDDFDFIKELKLTSSKKVVTVPLELILNILESEVNGTDRLQIDGVVAGLASSSSLCLDQSLITAILIFWIIFQTLILLACCIMVKRYRYKSLDDDRSSQGYYPDSLENRHVRWADQGSRPHDTYFQ